MTNLYLQTTTADSAVTVGTGTKWLASSAAGGASRSVVKHGAVSPPLQITDGTSTTDGTVVSWYSGQLHWITIAGTVTCSLWDQEVSANSNVAPVVQIERCDSVGNILATIWSAASHISSGGPGEMTTAATGTSDLLTIAAASLTSTTLNGGDRLRISLWIDSAANQSGSGTMSTAATQYARFWVNGPTGSAGQSQIAFTESLTAYIAPETSPSLEVYGFSIPSPPLSNATINNVTVAITEYQSNAIQDPCTFELWDYSSTPAQIGTTQHGTPSTSTANVSSATFTGVTYAMLATLRVRVYGNAIAGTSYVESVDGVSLVVNYTPSPNATVTMGSALAVTSSIVTPTVTGSGGGTTVTMSSVLAVTTTKPAPAISPGPATFAVTTAFPAPAVSPGPATFAITTAFPTPAISPGPVTKAISTAFPAPAVSPGPAVFAVTSTFPAPAVSPGPASFAATTVITTPTVTTTGNATATPTTLSISAAFPSASVSPVPAALTITTAKPAPAISPGPATFAVTIAELAPAVSPGPATLAVTTTEPAPAIIVLETSPYLELYGFVISGPGASDTINNVTIAITEHQSDPAQPACTFQLWDSTSAQIGATQTGTASTSTGNISTAVFTGVTYAQLATLRVRIFGSANSSTSYTESVDSVSLVVNYTVVAGNVTVTPGILSITVAEPAPVVQQDQNAVPSTLAVTTTEPVPLVRQDVTLVPAVLAVNAVPSSANISPNAVTFAVTTAEPAAAVSPGPATLVVATAQSASAVSPGPATSAISTAFPAPAVSPGPAVCTISTSITTPAVVTSGNANATPATLAISISFPSASVSPAPATFAVNSAFPSASISPVPALLAINTSISTPAITTTSNANIAPAILAIPVAFPTATVIAGGATSPGLEIYGFGSFAGVGPSTVLNNITVAIGEFASAAGMQGATFELWDGFSSRIGTIQTGAASTSSANVDMAAFANVSYSQLATLRVRVYGHSGSAVSGSTESWDWASLTAVFIEPGDIPSPPVLALTTGFPAPAIITTTSVTVPGAGPATVATAVPAPAAGLLSVLVGVTTLAITAACATPTVTATDNTSVPSAGPVPVTTAVPMPAAGLLNAYISVAVLVITTAYIAPTVTASDNVSVPSAGPVPVTTAVPMPAAGLLNAYIGAATLIVQTHINMVSITVVANITVAISGPIMVPMTVQAPAGIDTNTSGPNYATNAEVLVDGGTGTISSVSNVTGVPDAQSTTWTSP